jgi:hypothetical protein
MVEFIRQIAVSEYTSSVVNSAVNMTDHKSINSYKLASLLAMSSKITVIFI